MSKVSKSSPTPMKPEAIKKLALQALDALKAEDVIVIDVSNYANFTDFMIFASGRSTRHVKSIANEVIETAKSGNLPPLGVEGEDVGEWILVDLGDVIVHVMLPDTREFYELEKLWGEELAGLKETLN
jgi:ribosome-associated protein